MNNFPIDVNKLYGIPLGSHPGAYGVKRKFNVHEGIDLYGKPGDNVYAIRDGEVLVILPFTGPKAGCPWWLDTDAVLVRDEDGYYVYGEVKASVEVGDRIVSGQVIATLTPVLEAQKFRKDIPGHSVTMLHLERYDNTYNPNDGWATWNDLPDKPLFLQDPTPALIQILKDNNINYKEL